MEAALPRGAQQPFLRKHDSARAGGPAPRIGGRASASVAAAAAPRRRIGLERSSTSRQRIVERDLEQLLEAQVGDVAIAPRLDERRPLVVARDLRAQQVELRHVADLAPELRLLEHELGLRERRLRDRDETVGERRVEVGLGDVELHLRALRFDSRCCAERSWASRCLRSDRRCVRPVKTFYASVQAERPLVLCAEAGAAEVEAAARPAGRRLRECRIALRPASRSRESPACTATWARSDRARESQTKTSNCDLSVLV